MNNEKHQMPGVTYTGLKVDEQPENVAADLIPVPVLQIIMEGQERFIVCDPNGLAKFLIKGRLPLGEPFCESELTGVPGYRYRTDQVDLCLAKAELVRLVAHALRPDEYFRIRGRHGLFHEIHEDFYDPDTGEAFQTIPIKEVDFDEH